MESLLKKIRALIEDFERRDSEIFEYLVSPTFIIGQENIEILRVIHNDQDLGSEQWQFDKETNELTIIEESGLELKSGDKIKVLFNYYNFSETELKGYIQSALVRINMYSDKCNKYEVVNGTMFPTPNDDIENLIAFIAGIIINPNYSQYKLPNHTVVYAGRNISKEEKIKRLIKQSEISGGIFGIIELN